MAEYINRDDLLKVIYSNVAEKHNERCSQLLEAIINASIVDVVEVKHGEWVKYSTDLYGSNHKCSKCGKLADEDNSGHYAILTNYCPNCGAKMDGTPKERGGEK